MHRVGKAGVGQPVWMELGEPSETPVAQGLEDVRKRPVRLSFDLDRQQIVSQDPGFRLFLDCI